MYFYKNPSETKKYTVSFADSVLTSESIQSSGLTISITNLITNGVSTSSIYVSGSLGFADSDVSFRASGGEDDSVYKFTLSTGGVTSSGNVYTKTGYIYVAEAEQVLVPLDELKAYMGVASSAHDAVLLSLLRGATDLVCKITGREFAYKTYTETCYPEQLWDRLKLDNYPVDAINSVVIDGITLDATTAGYSNYVAEEEGFVRRMDGGSFPQAPFATVVTYRAGFKAIPEDIKYVVKKIAASDYNTRLQDGILSEALGSYKVTYAKTALLTEDSRVREILNQYTPRVL